MKTLIIMRGLPGSGKTHAVNNTYKNQANTTICSADYFFMVTGEYKFDPRLLKQAHESCKYDAAVAMQSGVETVVIDNTNTQKWEYEDYLHMAATHGYDVVIKTIGSLDGLTDQQKADALELYAKRNTHGVPLTALQRMAARWEN